MHVHARFRADRTSCVNSTSPEPSRLSLRNGTEQTRPSHAANGSLRFFLISSFSCWPPGQQNACLEDHQTVVLVEIQHFESSRKYNFCEEIVTRGPNSRWVFSYSTRKACYLNWHTKNLLNLCKPRSSSQLSKLKQAMSQKDTQDTQNKYFFLRGIKTVTPLWFSPQLNCTSHSVKTRNTAVKTTKLQCTDICSMPRRMSSSFQTRL